MKCANQNGYSVIRILQKDIWHNKYNWLTELLDNINKIQNNGIVQNIYMGKKMNIKILRKKWKIQKFQNYAVK